MKSIKKITVFYTDGTFEDIEKTQTVDLGKINTSPAVSPNPWWTTQPQSYTYNAPISTPKVETFTVSPQPMGSATLTTASIQALTTAQISSLTGSSMDSWRVHDMA